VRLTLDITIIVRNKKGITLVIIVAQWQLNKQNNNSTQLNVCTSYLSLISVQIDRRRVIDVNKTV
jgi:hypothetical protein